MFIHVVTMYNSRGSFQLRNKIIPNEMSRIFTMDGKVVPVLPLIQHHAIKAYWGVEVQLHTLSEIGTRRR